jgi:CRP-like cAMP-binding protein
MRATGLGKEAEPGRTGAMAESEILGMSLFAGIGEESAATVAAGGVTDVPAGQVLAQAGDQGFGMFVVLDGSVVVERGDLHIEMGRDGFFGELALLVPDSPRIARVRAKTDARVLAVPRQTFDLLLETEPSFARALLRELAARLVQARTGH